VRVEARGEDRVSGPCPPDQHEQWGEPCESHQRVLSAQRRRNLGDSRHEDEIEEQLEPGDLSSGCGAAGRPQPERRDEVSNLISTLGQFAWPLAMYPGMSASHFFCTRFE